MLDQPVPHACWQSDRKESTGGFYGSGWHGCHSRLAWHPVAGLYCSSLFPAKIVVQCLLPRLPPHSGSSGQPSSAAQLPRHMSKPKGADPARSAPQPAPQTIRAAGAACAVAIHTPAGAKRRVARMLPNIDRGKWGQHLYQIRSGCLSRASAQTAVWSSP
jgi:hypothetical protein